MEILGLAAKNHWHTLPLAWLIQEAVMERKCLDAVVAVGFVDRLAIGNSLATLADELGQKSDLTWAHYRILDIEVDCFEHRSMEHTLVADLGLDRYEKVP